MFKFLKKAITPKVNTQAIIAEIHNEFDTAGEKLLFESKRILSQDVDVDKGGRLKNIGFSSVKAATDVERILKEKKESKELAELIEYYSQWYPHNKFITEQIVEVICKKYHLLCGEVSQYIGDVPDKNLMEIEQFKLRDDDMTVYYKYRSRYMADSMLIAQSSRYMGDFYRPKYEAPVFTPEQWDEQSKYKPGYKICAPETDFNTRGMTKYGHKLIPDPIVLQPVKGGYLIISKWGLEAADESLTNEKLN